MACFYGMDEMSLPFEKHILFHQKPEVESSNSGIFVRDHGTTVEISELEWNRRYPGRLPVRMIT